MKAANKTREWGGPFGAYVAGALLSSAILGTILGILGSIFLSHQWELAALIGIAIIGIGLALCDLGIGGTKTPTLRRQTCPIWWRTFRRSQAAFLWGLDLGLGFTTIRIASLYWIIFLIVFVLASPLLGAVILSGYGLALVINLSTGIWLLEHKDDYFRSANMRALQLSHRLQIGLGIILLLWSIMLIIVVLEVH